MFIAFERKLFSNIKAQSFSTGVFIMSSPFYRIVVADSRSPRDGKFIEEIGYYDPTREPSVIKFDEEATKKWIATGAQPTETVGKLLKIAGIQ